MSQCQSCRKQPADLTWWEVVCEWVMYHLFPREIKNLSQEKYSQGFADGRKEGFIWCMNQQKTREETLAALVLEGKEDLFTKYTPPDAETVTVVVPEQERKV